MRYNYDVATNRLVDRIRELETENKTLRGLLQEAKSELRER